MIRKTVLAMAFAAALVAAAPAVAQRASLADRVTVLEQQAANNQGNVDLLNQVTHERCTIEHVVSWMCDAPARVWDIVGKGRIEVGYDADLVLVDLAKTATVENEHQETKCRWSPWHGTSLTGWPVRTWVMGREVFRAGRFDASVRGDETKFDHARGGYWATG